MATIKLLGKRDAETDYAENRRELSDLDYDRVAYWAAMKFFPQGVVDPGSPEIPGTPDIPEIPEIPEVLAQAAVLDADGNVITPAVEYQPAIPGTPAVPGTPTIPAVPASVRAPTGAEIFHALTDSVYEQIKREAEAWYLTQAEAAARESVQPIVLVPAT